MRHLQDVYAHNILVDTARANWEPTLVDFGASFSYHRRPGSNFFEAMEVRPLSRLPTPVRPALTWPGSASFAFVEFAFVFCCG